MSAQDRESERYPFRLFWKWLTGAPITDDQARSMRPTQDPPDFKFEFNDRKVALELAHLFQNQPLGLSATGPSLSPLHKKAIGQRVCNHLNTLLDAKPFGTPVVSISITFGSCADITDPQKEKLTAQRVLELCRERLAKDESRSLELYPADLAEISPSLVDLVLVPFVGCSYASRNTRGGVDEWGLPSIEAAAAQKEPDLPRYSAQFDECWLLLSAGGSEPAQWFEPSVEACAQGIRSQFDRIFLVDESAPKSRQHVYEIVVAEPREAAR